MNKQYSFPDLQGTQKQVEWAQNIRDSFFEHWSSQEIDVQHVILNQTKAEFWINNRQSMTAMVFLKEQLNTNVAYPEVCTKQGIVKIEQHQWGISIIYVKDDDFIGVAKQCKLRWNKEKGRWERYLSDATGAHADRIAEIGYLLIKNGFAVEIVEDRIRKMAQSGKYKDELPACIGAKKTNGDLIVKWHEKNDVLYNDAKAIKGATWDKDLGSMIIHVSQHTDVEALARKHNLPYTDTARTKIKNYKQEIYAIKQKQGNL